MKDERNESIRRHLAYRTVISDPVEPTATDYVFGGWYKESECINAWDFANDTVTSDVILYAKWIDNK